MEEKQIRPFLGKYVKLVRLNNFVLSGTIEDVYSDSILFVTPEERALIVISDIKAIHEKRKVMGGKKREWVVFTIWFLILDNALDAD